ncbi:MAG: hypothetical protein Q8876_02940 [Bacillota bacterium]|nr:hypothetical protein [Bacillota bacterium]
MKKTLSLTGFFALIILLSTCFFGCGKQTVTVNTIMQIDSSFSGQKVITCSFPNSMISSDQSKKQLAEIIKNNCPKDFSYGTKATDNGTSYIFTLSFTSKADYQNKIKDILSRDTSVALATPKTVLTKGIRYSEDFDTADLLKWLFDNINSANSPSYNYQKSINGSVVTIGGQNYETGSKIEINNVTGYAINNITVETTNNKNGLYDRNITYYLPRSTYNTLGQKLTDYFKSLTDSSAVYADWSQSGNTQEYQIRYRNLSLSDLNQYTQKALDTNNCSVSYNSVDTSTPLAEQYLFNENLSMLNFMGNNRSYVPLTYLYSLPSNAIPGDGTVFDSGSWVTKSSWPNGEYTLNISNCKTLNLRVPDGIHYDISGIRMKLYNNGGDNFTKTISFLYNSKTGQDGQDYCYGFLKAKKTDVSKTTEGDLLLCTVKISGSSDDINTQLGTLFGGGNYISYRENNVPFSLITKTEFKDSVNFSYMLTGNNINKPFTYTVYGSKGQQINSLKSEGKDFEDSKTLTYDSDGGMTVKISGGDSYITCNGSLPYMKNIIFYCIVSALLICITVLAIVLLKKRYAKRLHVLNREDFENEHA